MHYYRQSIILFGIVLPALGTAAIVGIGAMAKSKVSASFDNKLSTYKTYERSSREGREIESQVTRQRDHIARWNQQLSEEVASTVASNLREISATLPTKEFQQTAFERPSASGGFGAASAQKSSQLRIAFRGTFRTVQKALLELETRLPQLQLQELRMEPSTGGASVLLNFQVTYTAWES
jgi:hypothetical protein